MQSRRRHGARRKDIRSQFVIEAGTTSAIGGLLGIGFGCLLAKLLEVLLGGIGEDVQAHPPVTDNLHDGGIRHVNLIVLTAGESTSGA